MEQEKEFLTSAPTSEKTAMEQELTSSHAGGAGVVGAAVSSGVGPQTQRKEIDVKV